MQTREVPYTVFIYKFIFPPPLGGGALIVLLFLFYHDYYLLEASQGF